MKSSTHRSALFAAIAVALAAGAASAQQIVTYGSAEAGGAGSSLFFLGASISRGTIGWGPVASVDGYRLQYRSGPGTTSSNNVFMPSAGLKYQTAVGATQARVGYAFVGSSTDTPTSIGAFPFPASAKNGVFVTGQGDYWGTGRQNAQVIGSWNFANQFLWSRARASQRIGGADSPIMLGGEVGFLGGGDTGTKTWGFFAGPTVTLRATPDLRFTAAAGYRANTSPSGNGTGYGKLDFVYIFPKM